MKFEFVLGVLVIALTIAIVIVGLAFGTSQIFLINTMAIAVVAILPVIFFRLIKKMLADL